MNMLLFIPSVRDSGLYLESYDLALAFTTYHLKFHRKLLRSYLLHAFYFNLLILTSPHLTSPHLTSPLHTTITSLSYQELDEAARRRFVKRIYIPLPDPAGRKQLLMTLMKTSLHSLGKEDLGKYKRERRRKKGKRRGRGEEMLREREREQ